MSTMSGPQRIVCLTEETTETLYSLGEQDRIVGISAFTVRPPEARRDKPVVSQYIRADVERILAVKPDLVLAFSDLQADICADLIRRGLAVHCFNQRNVESILEMIRTLSRMVDAADEGERLCNELEGNLARAREAAARLPYHPRVYFEEWPDPIITGITWVSELIEIAGGIDCFADNRGIGSAKDRVVSPEEVLRREPDLYLASWCGKKFNLNAAKARPGFADAPFLREGRFAEIDSSIILQPGPAALSDGLAALEREIARVAEIVGCVP
ncbi:MAG: cobalamin-binding protein [Phycisphaerae bacterium]|nr:cobalamin-binding protein [Phycisphaerae bacterium]